MSKEILKEIKTLENELGIYLSCIDSEEKEDLIIIRDYLTKVLTTLKNMIFIEFN